MPLGPSGETTHRLTSLVFPAYNPGDAIERTWIEVRHFLRWAPGNWEVLFVCDGCTDGSPQRLHDLIRGTSDNVRVINYTPNRGKGYAVRQGLLAAAGDWRIFTDIDLAYRFEDILLLAESLQSGAPVAIASRHHAESRLLLPPALQGYLYRRHLQSQVFSQIVRLLLPLRQRDTQAGLKGMSARTAEAVMPHLRSDGFGFDCELLTACVRLGIPVTEVPVWVQYDSSLSTTSWGRTAGMLQELWRIRKNWREAPPLLAVPVESAVEQRLSA